MLKTITAAAAFALMAGTAMAQDAATTASANFVDGEGASVGTAKLTDTPNGVLIEIDVTGMPADEWVGFHVHETGECDAATHHESAGGHFNPTGKEHGYLVENGPHAGDMPNQYVAADGTLKAQVFNSFVRLGDGETGITGRALMIHGGTDDYTTQPTGDAGDRHACAVIE